MAFQDEISIDIDQLEVELLTLPELYSKYALKAAEEKARVDRLKNRLDLKYAELFVDIKQNPEQYGLDKATEATIQATIQKQPDYRRLQKQYLSAKENLETYKVAMQAIEQKKHAIENLIKLMSMEYFSPTGDIDLSGLKRRYEQKRRKIVRESTRSALNRISDD